jgi:hypothetical protein
MWGLLLACALAAQPSPVAAQKPKLAVLDLVPGAGVDASVTGPLTEAISTEVQRRAFFEVLSQRDIATMIGIERQKQLLGCSDEGCLAELSGAIGARFVLSGTLARLGDAYQLTLTALDTQKTQTLGRSTKLTKDLPTLNLQLPFAVAEATGTPPPAPPSKVLPYTLLGIGAATVLAGTLLGTFALNTQGQLRGELEAGVSQPGILKTQDYYVKAIAGVDRDKVIALALLGGGVALAAAGLLILPKDFALTQVSFAPTANGAVLAGTFP